ncbi:MAG: RraA family protein [Rubrobacteraceae bacterium]
MARIIEEIERPPKEVVEGFRDLLRHESVTCAVSDRMGRMGAMTSGMTPLFEGMRFVGVAVTAKTLASDLAAPFKAIDLCRAGDVVVVDSHGSEDTAFWGENMALSAMNRGVVGAVIDGACRDVEEIRRMKFPVVCKGVVPNVASVSGYGEVNVPIQCAGVVVNPGDIIVVDGNGVVAVPRDDAPDVLSEARELLETEHVLQEKIEAGATIGELVGVDEVFEGVFAYQERATREEE